MVVTIRSSMLERLAAFLGVLVMLSGCTTVMSSVTSDMSDGLSQAMLDSEDLDGVRDGAPAFLLMLDGFLARDPNNAALLVSAARLNSSYAGAFVDDPTRQLRMSEKALTLAAKAACIEIAATCGARTQTYDAFSAWIPKLTSQDVELAYTLGSAWAGWIQLRADDWDAIAELSRAKALMVRVAVLDESYDHGSPDMYLGVFETLLPPAMGGRPEVGRAHFERAIALSGGRNLMAKVMFAERYARMMFERELHDELLTQVLDADVREPGLTLVNSVAQQRARALMASADSYF